jgi:uncharacterized protein YcbK (DUF882 family)
MLIDPGTAYKMVQSGHASDVLGGMISDHFSWGEVFTNCSTEDIKALDISIYQNAFNQSFTMEMVRNALDCPLHVNSWYRTKEHNAAIGGAPNSYHLFGLATDFIPESEKWVGVSGLESARQWLNKQNFMKTRGMEDFPGMTWIHIDSREKGPYRFGA